MQIEKFEFADHVIGFITSSTIDADVARDVHAKIDKVLEHYDQISLYFEDAVGKVDLEAIYTDLIYKIKHADRFHKIAIVSDDSLFKAYGRLKNIFMNADIKVFSLKARTEALTWVSAP